LAKLLGAYLVPAIATFVGFGVVAHWVARRALEKELGQRLTSIAAAAAAEIADENVALLAPGDEGTRTYRNLQRRLGELATNTGAARIYVFAKDRTSRADTRSGVAIGERYYALDAWQSELRRVFSGTPASPRCATTRATSPTPSASTAPPPSTSSWRASAARSSRSAPAARSPSSRSRSSSPGAWRSRSAAWRAPPSASARASSMSRCAARPTTRSARSPIRWIRCASSCAPATSGCR